MARTRRAALRLGGAGLAALAGCVGGPPSERTVEMKGLAFDSETATVGVGGTVTWTNEGEVDHTVTADADRIPESDAYFASGGFDSERAARDDMAAGLIAPGGTYEHTFETAGTYGYYCIPHESSGMVGTVRVK